MSTDESKELTFFLPAGTIVGNRYRIDEVIGHGGFGITYAGQDQTLDRKIAVKEYFPGGMASRHFDQKTVVPTGGADGHEYTRIIEKFLSEAKTLAAYNDAPNIVHVYDYLEENNTAYIIMEFIEGQSLEEYLTDRPDGRVSTDEAVRITTDVLGVLSTVHKQGILHRDISPENIMIESDGTVRLIDFGAARQYSAEKTQNLTAIVRGGYSAPEQYRADAEQDERSDLFSLGCVLYRMVTGKNPANVLDRLQTDNLRTEITGNPDVPNWLAAIIARATELFPNKRFQSTDEFAKAIHGGKKAACRKKLKIAGLIGAAMLIAAALAVIIAVKPGEEIHYAIEGIATTVDLHQAEECDVYLEVGSEPMDTSDSPDSEFEYKLDNEKPVSVSADGSSKNHLILTGLEPGHSSLLIETEDSKGNTVSKTVSINVKEKEKTYPEIESDKKKKYTMLETTLEVGPDIPPGEYVVFARSCRGSYEVLLDPEADPADENYNEVCLATEGFHYNAIQTLEEGQYFKLSNAYAVPVEEAVVDVSGEGTFKAGDMIEPGKYTVSPAGLHPKAEVYSADNTKAKPVDMNDSVYLSEEDNRYIKLDEASIDPDASQDVSAQDKVQHWELDQILLHGEKVYDSGLDISGNTRLAGTAEGDKFYPIAGMYSISPTFEKSPTDAELNWNGAATFHIPYTVDEVKETSGGYEFEASLIYKGKMELKEGNRYQFYCTEKDLSDKADMELIDTIGDAFAVEKVSDTEFKFYYDYYDAVLVFKR